MKKSKVIRLTAIALLFSANTIAQQSLKEVLHIKSARFATPLVEKWVSEYEKENPEVEIKFADAKLSDKEIDISLINSSDEENIETTNQVIASTGRYALLPVANAENPILNDLSRKGLNGKKLENLFFEKDDLDAVQESSQKEKYEITIYSGNNAGSFADIYASHFGYSSSEIRGRKISGDDQFLIHAIQKDNSGITFNNLNYIFDTETRKLKSGLSLIPLDVRKNQREILLEADIDKTIDLLEREKVSLIPVENIGFVYREDNLSAKRFLKWILTEGQQYNNEFGVLKVEESVLISQLKTIDELLLSSSN